MPARTLGTIAAAISRHTRGEVPLQEIMEAVNTASIECQSKYDWPWTFADADIRLQPSYSTGTVSILNNTKTVTLTGGTWDVTWLYKTLLLGSSYYPIDFFTSPTTAVLKEVVNQGQDFTDAGYTMFQQDYPLPDDCEPGSRVVVVNLRFQYRVKDVPIYTLMRQQAWVTNLVTNFQICLSDAGFSDSTRKYLIRFTPPPSDAQDLKIAYRRRVPDLSAIADQTLIPPSFDRAIELIAEYLVRFNQPTPMPGWMEKKAEGYQLLSAMRRKMATAPIDNYSRLSDYPFFENTSFYDPNSGAFVGPVTGFGL